MSNNINLNKLVIVGIGIIVLSRPSIIKQPLLIDIEISETSLNSTDPRHYELVGEKFLKQLFKMSKVKRPSICMALC